MKVLPSILTGDFTKINEDLKRLNNEGMAELHLDIMDGNFVPAMTFGEKYVADIHNNNPTLDLDVHLMIVNPENHIDEYIKAGADKITVHFETLSVNKIKKLNDYVKSQNCKFGVAINPNTDARKVIKILEKIDLDLVLVMSVYPGKGGQTFMEESLEKLKVLKDYKEKKDKKFEIEIDGGINTENVVKVRDCGAERIVIGSSIYKDNKLEENYKNFVALLERK